MHHVLLFVFGFPVHCNSRQILCLLALPAAFGLLHDNNVITSMLSKNNVTSEKKNIKGVFQ